MKITGRHPQSTGRRQQQNYHYRQLIVITSVESAPTAADSSAAFTMSWNQ